MSVWPLGLPQTALIEGYSENSEDVILKQNMDVGPDFRRRKQTRARNYISCSVILTEAQKGTLETFYDVTLMDGLLSFEWSPDGSSPTKTVHFVSPPVYRKQPNARGYEVGLSLEVL